MVHGTFFDEFDFTSIWEIRDGQTYTHMQYEQHCVDPSPMDVNEDCVVDLIDFSELAADWMECTIIDSADCPKE